MTQENKTIEENIKRYTIVTMNSGFLPSSFQDAFGCVRKPTALELSAAEKLLDEERGKSTNLRGYMCPWDYDDNFKD